MKTYDFMTNVGILQVYAIAENLHLLLAPKTFIGSTWLSYPGSVAPGSADMEPIN